MRKIYIIHTQNGGLMRWQGRWTQEEQLGFVKDTCWLGLQGPSPLLPGTASHRSVPNGSGWGGKCRTSRDLIPCLRREHLTGSGCLEASRPLATVMGSGMNV